LGSRSREEAEETMSELRLLRPSFPHLSVHRTRYTREHQLGTLMQPLRRHWPSSQPFLVEIKLKLTCFSSSFRIHREKPVTSRKSSSFLLFERLSSLSRISTESVSSIEMSKVRPQFLPRLDLLFSASSPPPLLPPLRRQRPPHLRSSSRPL